MVSYWHGVLFIAWFLWLCAVSRLACVMASRTVLAWRAVSYLAFVVASHAVLSRCVLFLGWLL